MPVAVVPPGATLEDLLAALVLVTAEQPPVSAGVPP